MSSFALLNSEIYFSFYWKSNILDDPKFGKIRNSDLEKVPKMPDFKLCNVLNCMHKNLLEIYEN